MWQQFLRRDVHKKHGNRLTKRWRKERRAVIVAADVKGAIDRVFLTLLQITCI